MIFIVPVLKTDGARLWPFSKKCLVELETATWCGYCPIAEKALAQLEGEYDKSELTIYSLHVQDQFSNRYANARMSEYGFVATPTAIFSGQDYHQGGDPQTRQAYIGKINAQLSQATPFSIRLSGKVESGVIKLNATVCAWKNTPQSDLNFTFLIGEKEAKGAGERAYWVLRKADPNPLGTSVNLDELSVSEYTCVYQIGTADPSNFYASFLIESFYKHNIYQYATWRHDQIETHSIDPDPGALLADPPEKIEFMFVDKITNAQSCVFMDEDMAVIDADIKVDDRKVTVTPKKKLEKGKSYYCGFKDGSSGIRAGYKKSVSPIFTFFTVKSSKEPPPNPPGTDPKPPNPPIEPQPPQLDVAPLGFNLGEISRINPTEFEFEIKNAGEGTITGKIESSCEYISFDKESFENTPITIKGKILPTDLQPGKEYKCMIKVDSSAGLANIGVNFSIPQEPPKLAFEPGVLDFSEDTSKMQKISIRNVGEATMVTKAIPEQSWIIVAPDIVVDNGDFMVAIDVSQLEPGDHKGYVRIESTGLKTPVQFPVIVSIQKPKEPTVIEMVVGNKLAIVNGNVVELKVPPQVFKGTTLVPFRFVAETFKATVSWEAKTRTVTMEFASKNLKVDISENKPEVTITQNGETRTEILSVPAKNISGTMCVPIRFFAQILGAKTDWDAKTKKITITWQAD
jgi:thiol-disulfide isomerase/thioredoxin